MSWLLAFIGFSLLIILHEAGHMVTAKAVGMRVERFFLFFPPKLVSFRRGETEYGIGMIPLGGFVKITGMNPDEVHPPTDREPEKGSRLTALMEGDTAGGEDDFKPLPPGVVERAYYNQPVWKRIVVIAAGPAVNIVLAFIIFVGLGLTATKAEGPELQVKEVSSKSPAQGQLQKGDRLISVDGVTGNNLSAADRGDLLSDQISSHTCAGEPTEGCAAATPATLIVDRDGTRHKIVVAPRYDPSADPPRTLIGFVQEPVHIVPAHYSLGTATSDALSDMWTITSKTATVFSRLFDAEQRKQVSGVVGSYDATRQAFDLSTRMAFFLLGIISLSLGVINLLPFLPLDGGHIFWGIVEKLRGRSVPFWVMERASLVGIGLFLVLFIIGLNNDISRIVDGKDLTAK